MGSAVKIWTLVIFFNIDNSCVDQYKDNAPELWTLVQVESITILVLLGIIGLVLVGAICFCCFGLFKMCCEEKDKSNGTSTAKHVDVGAVYGYPQPTTTIHKQHGTADGTTAPPALAVMVAAPL